MSDSLRRYAAILGLTGVGLGAFGAHMLKKTLLERQTTESWKTAVSYQLLHAIALLVISTRDTEKKSSVSWNSIGYCWLFGALLFSGSIYGLSLGGPRLLGPVTPLGGTLMMIGWGMLFFGGDGSGKDL
jgi:uncharacterized membrane protein YgdD (TMEM256/DUF423 family)